MAHHISWRTCTQTGGLTTVTIETDTDVPAHCWCRVSSNPPDVHRVARMKRGLSMPEEYYFCFTAYTDYEQIEPGDTFHHTFVIPDWPYCVTKYFYFYGYRAGVKSYSTSCWFKYHNTYLPPPVGFVGFQDTLLRVGSAGNWALLEWVDGTPLSAHLPDNTTAVFLHVINGGSNQPFGVKRGDSVSDFKEHIEASSHLWCQGPYTKAAGCRVWLNSTANMSVYLTGYAMDNAVVTFKEPLEISVPTTWTWTTKDLSVSCPGASMVFMMLRRNISENFAAVRCYGSSDDRSTTFILAYPTIACSSGQLIQCKNSAWFVGSVRFFVTGYIKAYSGSWVNGQDIKPTLANTYQIRNFNPKPGLAFAEVSSGAVNVKTALKINGGALELFYKTAWGFQWACAPMDAAGNIQVKAAVANHAMWKHGYGV